MGTCVGLSIRELCEALARATGYSGTNQWDISKKDGTPKKQLDVSRLASLGWRARIPPVEGLLSTVVQFRKQLTAESLRLE